MAKNVFGFIQKKYRQPDYEREAFGSARAFYKAGNGRLFIIVPCTTKYQGAQWGKDIVEYQVCEQKECVHVMRIVPSQKRAMEVLEQLLADNAA